MSTFKEDQDDQNDALWDTFHGASSTKAKYKFNLFDDEVSLDEITKSTAAWHADIHMLEDFHFDDEDGTINTHSKSADIESSLRRRDCLTSSEPSIEEVVGTINRRAPTTADIVKLEEEIHTLRRSLQSSRRDRWSPLAVDETIRRLIVGEPYSLEMYRSKEDKLALLDTAIKIQDGNAIIVAVLFLKTTVKSSLFNLELSKRPAAANHYISYLKAHFDFTELADALGMLGRTEEVAMLKYKQAISVVDPGVKINNLENCLRAHFKLEPFLSHDNTLVKEHISLLERQRPIEDSDVETEKEGKTQSFRQYPRVASIINMPLVTTLYYCSFYHYELAENHLASPVAIRKQHQISDKQFLWTVLSARARLKRWLDIEGLLTTKGWFGGAKLKAAIGFDKVVDILNRTGAPPVILSKYLKLVDDAERRVILGKKYCCHDVVVETYMSLRDRAELEAYASQLKPRSPEHQYAQDALRNTTIKWKS